MRDLVSRALGVIAYMPYSGKRVEEHIGEATERENETAAGLHTG